MEKGDTVGVSEKGEGRREKEEGRISNINIHF
jgi:hypothetical protein